MSEDNEKIKKKGLKILQKKAPEGEKETAAAVPGTTDDKTAVAVNAEG